MLIKEYGEVCNELRFTPEDILIKRDIDYINKTVYPKEYEENTYTWKEYTWKEKADLIRNYTRLLLWFGNYFKSLKLCDFFKK